MAKNVATIEDFERLKNPDTGLVAMSFLVPTITEFVGDIRGAEPITALRWYNEHIAEPVKKLTATGDTTDTAKRPSDTGGGPKDASAVPIAENWQEQHYLQRIALAKRIAGKDEKLTVEQADAVIDAEAKRRVSDTGGGPNALTTDKTVTR